MAPVLKVFGVEYSLFGLTQLFMFFVNLLYWNVALVLQETVSIHTSRTVRECCTCLSIHPEPANTVLYILS